MEQALAFVLRHLLDRHARPAGHDLSDILLGDHVVAVVFALLPGRALLGDVLTELSLLVPQAGGLFKVLMSDGFLLFILQGLEAVLLLLDVGRGGEAVQPHARGGLVHQVDGLVGQETVADIAVGQADGGLKRLVGDFYLVMRLVAVAQALENSQRLFGRGLAYLDRLEAALQRGVLFNVLAVFVQGGRADALQLAAGESGLEDVGGVHAAFGLAGAHQRVELVDKENHVPLFLHILDGILEPLLKLAPVLASGDHAAQVQGQDALAGKGFGNLAGHDHLGQALHHGAFAHARLTDEHGVVFGAAAHDLHDAFNFRAAANHRVQLAVLRSLGQVAAVFFQHAAFGLSFLALGRGNILAAVGLGFGQRLENFLLHFLRIHAHAAKQAHGHAFALLEKGKPEMLRAHKAVVQLAAFQNAAFQNFFAARGQLQHAAGLNIALAQKRAHALKNRIIVDIRGQHIGYHGTGLLQQAQKNMLRPHIGLVQQHRRLLGGRHGTLSPLGKASENCHIRTS